MVWQDDKHADPALQSWGCGLFVAEWFSSLHTAKSTTINRINQDFKTLTDQKIVDADCFVNNWISLFKYLNLRVELVTRDATHRCRPGEFELLYWYNPESGLHHFTAGDGRGRCTYDPLRKSKTVANGFVESKRVFHLGRVLV